MSDQPNNPQPEERHPPYEDDDLNDLEPDEDEDEHGHRPLPRSAQASARHRSERRTAHAHASCCRKISIAAI